MSLVLHEQVSTDKFTFDKFYFLACEEKTCKKLGILWPDSRSHPELRCILSFVS